MRTPLNAIVGFSQILEDQITDSTQQQYLKI
ncbi:MAG: histidine kinase dimerization/phospho-acceptor domain-containing protein [Bacillota bacterium]